MLISHTRGSDWVGYDPGSRLLFCQIPVSRLHYVRKQFSFFCNARVPLDIISRFHVSSLQKVQNPRHA